MPPDVAAQRLDHFLATCGYDEALLMRQRQVWLPGGAVHPEVVGFGRANGPLDSSTATLVASANGRGGQGSHMLERAAFMLAAPFVLQAEDNHLSIKGIGASGEVLFGNTYGWDEALHHLSRELAPGPVLSLKLGHRQTSLLAVDVNLLKASRASNEQAIGPRVAELLVAADDALGLRAGDRNKPQLHAQAARLVIGALTAVVLRDKEPGVPVHALSAGALLDRVQQRHPKQFRWVQDLGVYEFPLLEQLIQALEDVDFTFAEPAVLSTIYESRLVNEGRRKALGAYYTPPQLAAAMLQALPLEELDPDQRRVLDPTCGSGTLLLAAHDRLRALQPEDWSLQRSHQDLAALLHGTDIDPVAVEIANLSLLLHALPAGNGWNVRERDALAPAPQSDFDVIVTNPPWRWSNQGKHQDVAHAFLERCYRRLRPGGLLGVLMPEAWLTRASSRASRALLRERVDMFECWRLPAGTFQGAGSGAAIVMARRRQGRSRKSAVLLREVEQPSHLASFYATRAGTYTLADAPNDQQLGSGPVARHVLLKSPSRLSVSDYADVVSGPQPAPVDERTQTGEANAFFLANPGDVPRFALVPQERLHPIRFPQDMQYGSRRGAQGLGVAKVLVGAAVNPTTPWRLRAVMDEVGCLPRNTASMVIPRSIRMAGKHLSDDEVRYGLLAYLGSSFSSALVADTARTRMIGAPLVRALIAPQAETLVRLAQLGRLICGAATFGDANEVTHLQAAIDELVWAWAGVEGELLERTLRRFHSGSESPELDEGSSAAEVWARPGVVLAVRPPQHVRLEVPGVTKDDGEWLRLPRQFPGALLRPGTAFVAYLAAEAPLAEASFAFDEVAYLDDRELERFFA